MPESLFSIEKSLVFRETFKDAYSVQNNRYAKGVISGGVIIKDSVAKFDGKTGYIDYNFDFDNIIKSTFSIKFRIKFYSISIQGLFTNIKTSSPGNGLYFSYFSDTPNYRLTYVGVSPSYQNLYYSFTPIKDKYYELVLTKSNTHTSLYCDGILITNNLNATYTNSIGNLLRIGNTVTGYFHGEISLFEIYNRTISSFEIKNQYNQKNKAPIQLPLLLDFDSIQGVVEDLTGKNKLTATSIDIKQLGKIKTVRFNGTSSKIETSQNSISTRSVIISIWAKALRGSSDCYVGNGKFVFRHYQNNNSYLITSDGGSTNVVTNDNTIRKNKLTHLLIHRKSDGYVNFFINNVKTKTNIFSGTPNDVNVYPIVIGGASNLWYKGDMNKVQIFDATNLQDSQIDLFAAQLYSSQNWRFV